MIQDILLGGALGLGVGLLKTYVTLRYFMRGSSWLGRAMYVLRLPLNVGVMVLGMLISVPALVATTVGLLIGHGLEIALAYRDPKKIK